MKFGRRRVGQPAPEPLPSPLAGRNILVTGATGSFGAAFVKRCLGDGARRVVVFSRDELKQFTLRVALNDDTRLRFFVGDIRHLSRLMTAMHGVDTVVHAAAMKRIEVCEENPSEAWRTNVLGSQNVADAAIACGVARAVLLSTDKAPGATTLYGATKFTAERLWTASNVYSKGRRVETRLSATRYGNVIGSRGSVVHLWRDQAARGEAITITDARCTRFWMTLGQAVDFVVLALREMQGGEVFIPKAPSSPVGWLASAVVAGSAWRETGLRAGERLHETLISNDEARNVSDCGSYYVIAPESRGFSVGESFSFRSDTNPDTITPEGLREFVA